MVPELRGYEPGTPSAWSGRVDATEPRAALRWHQIVACLDLLEDSSRDREPPGVCMVGYACDEGVARNLGRRGAEAGPGDIRRALANLPVGFTEEIGLYDAGDVGCPDGDVEAAQLSLAEAVARIRRWGHFPLVLGGGHDLEYGHWLGVRHGLSRYARLDVAEVSPRFDDDGRTAKVAALFLFAAVERLIPAEARIDPSCGAHP